MEGRKGSVTMVGAVVVIFLVLVMLPLNTSARDTLPGCLNSCIAGEVAFPTESCEDCADACGMYSFPSANEDCMRICASDFCNNMSLNIVDVDPRMLQIFTSCSDSCTQ